MLVFLINKIFFLILFLNLGYQLSVNNILKMYFNQYCLFLDYTPIKN